MEPDKASASSPLSFSVNGETRRATAPPMSRLLDVLRDEWGLTGTKEGCGEGECGSCAVFMDGVLVNSCLVPVLQAAGTNITTIEGITQDATSGARCRPRFSSAAERNAGFAPRGWFWRRWNCCARMLCLRTTRFAKASPGIFAGAPDTCIFLGRWLRRRGEKQRDESGSRGLRMRCAGQFTGGRDPPGGGTWRVGAAGGRDRRDGFVRSRKTCRAEICEYLEFAGIAANRRPAGRNHDGRRVHVQQSATARFAGARVCHAGGGRFVDGRNCQPESRDAGRQYRQCFARRGFPARAARL